MLSWYQARLTARPFLTQALTTSILFGVGDIAAQQLVEKRGVAKHEVSRTARMMLYGGAVFGPAATTWFKLLQTRVHIASSPNGTILARVALDQGVFAPTFIAVFLSSMAVLEGSSPGDKLARSYFPALSTNYMLWPVVQLINFKLVPLHHRVLFVNLVSIGWNSYLSFLNGSK